MMMMMMIIIIMIINAMFELIVEVTVKVTRLWDEISSCPHITVPGTSSETSLMIYQPTRRHLPEGSHIHYR